MVKSRTYQLSYVTNKWNEDDRINYSHAIARRLPAEVLYDTVYSSMGAVSNIPGVKPGTRAAELPDSGVELPSGFLSTFGRPPRESACECERSSGLQLGPVMALISGPTIAEAIADPKNALAKLVAGEKDDRKLVNEIFLRILNRPATDKEITASLAAIQVIDSDHKKLVQSLDEREKYVAPIRAKQEAAQKLAIEASQVELAKYEKELAPKLAEMEAAKVAQTAKLADELKQFETAELPKRQTTWETANAAGIEWFPLRASSITPTKGTTATAEADRAVFVEITAKDPKDAKGDLVVEAQTSLRGITAIRLEALADERLPRGGPGLADGNFVLTSFDVSAVSVADAKQTKKVEFVRPQADFAQENFSIAKTIDGNPNGTQGWAVSPAQGSSHWAVFETKEPIGFEGGTKLVFKLDQRFTQPKYLLGRFRLSVAVVKPVKLGLSEDLQAAIAVPAKQRAAKQQELLAKYYRGVDAELRKRQQAVAESKKPLPIDPHLKELQEKLELVSKPIPVDSLLLQLREDVKMSTGLLTNKRLTGAQDVAWALINSPAFLFNH
jgi:hypothetical protein